MTPNPELPAFFSKTADHLGRPGIAADLFVDRDAN